MIVPLTGEARDFGAPAAPASQDRRKPLLVTGTPRSGTTWVGRMLTASGAYHYLYEPFNPNAGVGRDVCDVAFERYFTYICADNESRYLGPMRDMVESRYRTWRGVADARTPRDLKTVWNRHREFAGYRRDRIPPLIKDPIALVSAGWMADRLDVDVVLMVRHPAAYAASMRRMGWGFSPRNWALSQPELMRDLLEPFRAELDQLETAAGDLIDQAALGWKVLNHVALAYRERHPDWLLVRHEDLSADPVAGFRTLYGQLGLPFDQRVESTVEEHSSETNPDLADGNVNTIRLNSRKNVGSWRTRLTAEEVARVRACVEPVSQRLYPDAEW